MTVENVNTPGNAVANPEEDLIGLGLEDATISDIVIPRIKILHLDGRFQDNLSQAEFNKLTVIMLGLIKQRIFWDDEIDDGDRPKCKSPDFEHGFPNTDDTIPKDKRFPWEDSVFNSADFPPSKGINGLVTLPCASCNFKEWGANKKPPLCGEQHTYPVLYKSDDGDDAWVPALFTVQRTGIKPSKNYLSAFVQSKKPMFTAITEIGLIQQSRGTVRWSVPTFRRIGNTEPDMWQEYANTFRAIRDFVKQAPRSKGEELDEYAPEDTNQNTPPAVAVKQTAAQPAPQAQVIQAQPVNSAPADDDDDDLPF